MCLKNKKVLFITPLFPPHIFSGASLQAVTLAKGLKRKGWEVRFVALVERGDYKSCCQYMYDGFLVYGLPIKNIENFLEGGVGIKQLTSVLTRLFWILLKHHKKYKVIHCHTLSFPFTGISILGKLLGKRTLGKVTMSNDLDSSNVGKITGIVNRYFYLSFDCLVAISHEIEQKLLQQGVGEEKILRIPNTVDSSVFFPVTVSEKENLRRKLGLPRGIIALFSGGIIRRKGVDTLIDVWIRSFQYSQNYTLVLAGPLSPQHGIEDSYFKSIYQKIEKNNMKDRIIFTNKIENIEEYMQAADFFVFPSLLEGMPNVILETMACGTPAISFAVSGVRDIIDHRENGIIIPAGRTDLFQKAMNEISLNSDLRKIFSEKSVKKIREHFEINVIVERYIDYYQR